MRGVWCHTQPLKAISVSILYTFAAVLVCVFFRLKWATLKVFMWSSCCYFFSPLVYSPIASFQFLMFSLKQIWFMPDMVAPTLGRQKQENQQFKAILSYMAGLRPTRVTWDIVSKEYKNQCQGNGSVTTDLPPIPTTWICYLWPMQWKWEMTLISCHISPTSSASNHMTVPPPNKWLNVIKC